MLELQYAGDSGTILCLDAPTILDFRAIVLFLTRRERHGARAVKIAQKEVIIFG